jgi:hypothetical protein
VDDDEDEEEEEDVVDLDIALRRTLSAALLTFSRSFRGADINSLFPLDTADAVDTEDTADVAVETDDDAAAEESATCGDAPDPEAEAEAEAEVEAGE